MKFTPVVIFFLLLTVFKSRVFAQTRSPLSEFSTQWNEPLYKDCNTASNESYLTANEKEVIYILNLARAYPRLFCKSVVESEAFRENNNYYTSLVATMQAMQPLTILQPNRKCFASADCHAITSGRVGYAGHDRQSANCRKLFYMMGECCSYGEDTPLGIVMQLLVDDGVQSLGHRKICLGDYNSIGVSIQPHKQYGTNAVLDFY